MTIGIRKVRNKIKCHKCGKMLKRGKYYYTKEGKGILKYCKKCANIELMDFRFYNEKELEVLL